MTSSCALEVGYRYRHRNAISELLIAVLLLTWSTSLSGASSDLSSSSIPANSTTSITTTAKSTTTTSSSFVVDTSHVPTTPIPSSINSTESYLTTTSTSISPNGVTVSNSTTVDDENIAQDFTSPYNSTTEPFLLFCSVKSIKYWSPSCPIHSSHELLAHRPLTNHRPLKNGFSGIAVRRGGDEETDLVWFDVEKYEFHLARFSLRTNVSQCDTPLTFTQTHILNYTSNPFAAGYRTNRERMVKLATSSNHVFAANFLLNRIDIYELVDSELQWSHQLDVVRPSDIAYFGGALFYLENKKSICRVWPFAASDCKPSCFDMGIENIDAFTVVSSHEAIFTSKSGNLYRYDWNDLRIALVGHTELHHIASLSAMNSEIIFLSETSGEVHRFNLTSGHMFAVLIESRSIFDITYMGHSFGAEIEVDECLATTQVQEEKTAPTSNQWNCWILVCFTLGLFVGIIVLLVVFCSLRFFHVQSPLDTICSKLPHPRGWMRGMRSYNPMRSHRATSVSENVLIESDEECDQSTQNYRHNLNSHRPIAARDIEDLIGSGSLAQDPTVGRCIACREPALCQDKDICMATYRVQQ